MASELIPYTEGPMTAALDAAGLVSSYDRNDRRQAMALYAAVQGADFALDDVVGSTIEVEHVVCHKAPMLDRETGETVETVRTVMIGPDGIRYSTRSETVRHDLQRSCTIFGMPFPWQPPLRFKVVLTKSRDGTRKYLQLTPEVALDA